MSPVTLVSLLSLVSFLSFLSYKPPSSLQEGMFQFRRTYKQPLTVYQAVSQNFLKFCITFKPQKNSALRGYSAFSSQMKNASKVA